MRETHERFRRVVTGSSAVKPEIQTGVQTVGDLFLPEWVREDVRFRSEHTVGPLLELDDWSAKTPAKRW